MIEGVYFVRMDKLQLPTVSLMGCTTRDHRDTLLALRHSQSQIEFGNTVYFSDIDPSIDCKDIVDTLENFEYIKCPKFVKYEDVCVWFMTSIFKYKHLYKGHVLGIHWDGYPVQIEAWNSEFLLYDYCGSPWPNKLVGNNGLWLFSQKLLDGIEHLNLPSTAEACHGSDKKICIEYRQQLIDFGVKFCPYELAFQFSTETYGYYDNPHGFKYNGSFGFHGLYSISSRMKNYKVNLPEHHLKWLDFKGDESKLLSVPEFLAT